MARWYGRDIKQEGLMAEKVPFSNVPQGDVVPGSILDRLQGDTPQQAPMAEQEEFANQQWSWADSLGGLAQDEGSAKAQEDLGKEKVKSLESGDIDGYNAAMKSSQKINSDILKDRNGKREKLQQMLNDYKKNDGRVNLAPLLALADSWTGSNMSRGYQPPKSKDDKKRDAIYAQKMLNDFDTQTGNLQIKSEGIRQKHMDDMNAQRNKNLSFALKMRDSAAREAKNKTSQELSDSKFLLNAYDKDPQIKKMYPDIAAAATKVGTTPQKIIQEGGVTKAGIEIILANINKGN